MSNPCTDGLAHVKLDEPLFFPCLYRPASGSWHNTYLVDEQSRTKTRIIKMKVKDGVDLCMILASLALK